MQSAMHIRLGELLVRQLSGDISEAEQAELEEMIATSAELKELYDEFHDPVKLVEALELYTGWNVETAEEREKPSQVKPILTFLKYAGAAVAIWGMVFAARYFLAQRHQPQSAPQPVTEVKPAKPFKANLQTGDGQVIDLTKKENGPLKEIKLLPVIKNDSQLVYPEKHEPHYAVMNTLQTPNGGLFQLKLTDGTRVWLNANSSISYPTSFNERERRVSVKGEAYFEVTKDSTRPFIIQTPQANVLVYGTVLNVRAYDDGETTTTLFEGAVKVQSGQDSTALKPGEQAVVNKERKIIKAPAVLRKAKAWQQGDFNFQGDNLESIMRELARWYNYQVKFNVPPSTETYTGEFLRSQPLREILKYFAGVTNYKITINNNFLIVNP